MKQQFRIFIAALCMLSMAKPSLAAPGFDYDINGKTKGTIYNKKCEDYTWYSADGTVVPKDQIICCDFDASGTYMAGGINCPYALPLPANDIGKSYGMSLYSDENVQIACNKGTGDVEIIDYRNKLKKVLLSAATDMYGNEPTHIWLEFVNEEHTIVRIYYKKATGNTIMVGDKSNALYKEFTIAAITNELYAFNIQNIVGVYPDPVSSNGVLTLENKLVCNCRQVTVKAYDVYGNYYATYTLSTGANTLVHGLQPKSYKLVVLIDNQSIGNIDLIVQ